MTGNVGEGCVAGGRSRNAGTAGGHTVQATLAVGCPVGCHQCVEALLGGHAVFAAAAAQDMGKAAAIDVVFHKAIQNGVAVLHEPAVLQRNAQFTKTYQHLHCGFAVFFPNGGVAAIVVLVLGKPGESAFGSCFDLRLILILGKGLQGHAGNIRIWAVAGQCPATAGDFLAQNVVDVGLPLVVGIVAAIQCNQRPDGAVDALINRLVEIIQRLHQIVAAHIGGIFANGSQSQNHAGILGVLAVVQYAVHAFDIGDNVVIVAGRHGIAASGQTDDSPFAANGTDLWIGNGFLNVFGSIVQCGGKGCCRSRDHQTNS